MHSYGRIQVSLNSMLDKAILTVDRNALGISIKCLLGPCISNHQSDELKHVG